MLVEEDNYGIKVRECLGIGYVGFVSTLGIRRLATKEILRL